MNVNVCTHQLYFKRAIDVDVYGIKKYMENLCAFHISPVNSIALKIIILIDIIKLCPTSNPFMPASMFMAFVQKTANIPIYT